MNKEELPEDKVISRFIAKIAFEFLAYKFIDEDDELDYFLSNKDLDFLRNYARYGDRKQVWPVNIRRVYDDNIKEGQILHEEDLICTKYGELYFVVIIFGIEFAINLAGPIIDGYKKWLDEHNQQSPLYCEKSIDEYDLYLKAVEPAGKLITD